MKTKTRRAGAARWRTRTSPTSPTLRPRASSGSLTGTGAGEEFFFFRSFVLAFPPVLSFSAPLSLSLFFSRLFSSLALFPSFFLPPTLLLILLLLLQPPLPTDSEVAKFCQKYLASRVRAHAGFATKRDVPRALADCFHEIDAMLASELHAAELEAMRAPPAPPLHLVKFGSEEVVEGEEEAAGGAENAPEGGEGGEDGGGAAWCHAVWRGGVA